MIDIDEYEKVFNEYPVTDYWPQTKRIQAHGVRLLKEVKRLRDQLAKANKYVHCLLQHFDDSMLMDYEDHMKGGD